MTGKVFSDSSDIAQDQAQVLFDYYRQAAEKIVAQEQGLEQRYSQTEQDRIQHEQDAEKNKRNALVFGVAAGVSLVLIVALSFFALIIAGVLGFMAYKRYDDMKKSVAAAEQCKKRMDELVAARNAIRRDYRVERIGVAYVPVARRIAHGEQSYVVDYTGEQPETEFQLTIPRQPEALKNAMVELHQQLDNVPAVESNEDCEEVDTSDYSTSLQDITLHDYMGTIDRQVRTVNYLVGDNREAQVSIPIVPPSSERYRFLSQYATTEVGNHSVVPVFDVRPVQQKVVAFSNMSELNKQSMEDGSGDVEFFTDVMRQLAQGVDLIARSKTTSVSYLTQYASHTLKNVLKASFDQYSPVLEADEIERIRTASFDFSDEAADWKPFSLKESSRVRYDMYSDTWVAEDNSRTVMPFGMHQVDAEVLMPVIANLMRENRKERLQIYNNIQDQKTDYLAQWHRDTDDFFGRNRTEANGLIQSMNEAYADYAENYTNYQQQSATFKAMKASGNLEDSEVAEADNQDEIIAGFVAQTNVARAKQEEFMQFMERIREDIDKSAERFGHITYYEASLRDSQARTAAQASYNVADLDQRRAQLVSVSPYLAQEGVLPPEPNTSEQLDQDFVINLSNAAESRIQSLHDEGESA
ncbi:MAG: hypothetical protein Q4B54_05245 [Coriobacteriales bacterium]|nr:hypothetical protein [Coriobacteriales bacterium]